MKSKRRSNKRYVVGYTGDINRRVIRDRLSAFRYARELARIDGLDTIVYDGNIKRFIKVYNNRPLQMIINFRQSYLGRKHRKPTRGYKSLLSLGRRIAVFGDLR